MEDLTDKIVLIKVKGTLLSGKQSDINFSIFEKKLSAKCAFINRNNLVAPETTPVKVIGTSVEDIEKQVIKERIAWFKIDPAVAFECGFHKFTTDYLPKSLDVSTGSIVDSNGQQSDQIDIIVSDSAKTPVFYEREGLRVVPVECVYSAIEVKAKLTIAEIEKSFKNMKSVRRLEKKAYFSTTCHCTINTAIR